MGVGKKGTRNATELPFLEISPKPTTFSGFRSRPRHDGPFVALGVSSTAGRRPETSTCSKPRLGRGLSTTDSFCGLEFRRGAMWGFPRRTVVVGIFAGAGRGTETRPCRAEIRPWAGQAGACARGAAKDVGTRSSTCANARNATSLPFLKSGDLSLLTTENKEIQEMQRS